LRAIRIRDGEAEVRAGATLLADSVPRDEEAETRLKASALLHALRAADAEPHRPMHARSTVRPGEGLRILMVDHQDSFVHLLSGCLQEGGAEVRTVRAGLVAAALESFRPDLVVLSPRPACPQDHGLETTIAQLR